MQRLINITFFLIIFNTLNRGFVPFIDLRAIVLIFIFLLYLSKLSFIVKKHYFIYICIAISIFLYGVLKYSIFPISPFDYFIRRFLQMFYIINVISFLILFNEYLSINIFKKYLLISGYFFIFSMFLQLLGINLDSFTTYDHVRLDLAPVKWLPEHFSRLSGFVFDPNVAGIYLGPLFFLSLSLRKYLFASIVLIFSFLTFSRGLFFAYFIVLLFNIYKKLNKFSKYLFIIILLLFIYFGIMYIKLFFSLSMLDSSNSERLGFWVIAIKAFIESHFLGIGLSNINYYMKEFGGIWVTSVHNAYLHLMSELGIIILVLILYIFPKVYKMASYLYFYDKFLFNSFIYVASVIIFISEQFDPMLYIIIVFVFIEYNRRYKFEKNIICT